MRTQILLVFVAFFAGCIDSGPAPGVFDGPLSARDLSAATTDLTGTSPPDMTLVCSFGGDAGDFPRFDKTCTNSASCSIGFHQSDCCGSLRAIGFNHANRDAFDAAEKQWEATCAKCNCPPAPTLTDDGKSGTMQTITVSCDSGSCVTHGK